MLVTDDNFSIPSEIARRPSIGSEIGLSDIRWILRRGWMLPLLGTLIGLAVAGTYVVFVPEVYKSSARILLDRSVNRYLQSSKIADEPILDDTDIGSQIYVLSSDSIIVPVVRSMNLVRDPEFVGPPRPRAGWGVKKFLEQAKNSIVSLKPQIAGLGLPEVNIRFGGGESVTPKIEPNVVAERTAVENFLKQLTVYREDVPNVINVTFASQDPVKAAAIANALADKYVDTTGDRKLKSNKMIGQLLEDRLIELKRQSDGADRALQEFADAHNLVGITVGRVSQAASETTPVTLPSNNELILKLRTQYVELAAKANELESQLGPAHLAVVKLRNQMRQLNEAIKNEDQRNGLGDSDQAKLRDLESSAATLHNLYNAALRKFSEANQVQPDTEDAHIITRATPPLYKNHKKSFLLLGGGMMLGFLSGVAAALGKEWVAGVFRTPVQVRNATGLYCAVLPTVHPHRKKGLEDYVIDAPYTRFTETVRNVRALLRADGRVNGKKVVGVVSSVSNEGKTTVVANLAALLNAAAPSRTLIIDCDLHRRTVTAELVPEAREGLLEALADPTRLAELVFRRDRSGVDILPCAMSKRNPNAAELLGSSQMENLLNAARESYDFIVIEVPPIMSVVDIKMIERFIDSFIFVIEWGKTKCGLVEEALSEVEIIRDRILCALLNKADPAALRSIEAYRGRRVGDYYIG